MQRNDGRGSAPLRTRLAALALAGATAAAATGCGGSASPPKPLTRAQLTAKADAICRRVIPTVDWLKVTTKELPKVVGRLAALEEQGAAELNKLVPPPSIADEWRLVVDAFELTGPEFRIIAREIERNSQAYLSVPLSNAQHERGLYAHSLHIEECAKY